VDGVVVSDFHQSPAFKYLLYALIRLETTVDNSRYGLTFSDHAVCRYNTGGPFRQIDSDVVIETKVLVLRRLEDKK